MQMSLRDGKRVTNDANRSPVAVAFPCAQVHHDTVSNLHYTRHTLQDVRYIHIQISEPQNFGHEILSFSGNCCFHVFFNLIFRLI